jgi:hypothetical protein
MTPERLEQLKSEVAREDKQAAFMQWMAHKIKSVHYADDNAMEAALARL